jgi:heme exporter protein C
VRHGGAIARGVWLAGTLAVLAYALRVALFVVPADAAQGDLSRIFYYHFPAWIGTSVFFALNLLGSLAYLFWRRSNTALALKVDSLAVASAEMGVVFCTVGLVTGSLWGRAAWGIWWTWDARLTSTLVLWLIYVAYLLLRSFTESSATETKRTLAAAMAVFGYLDVPLVYMSTRWWNTQHPGPVFAGGVGTGMDASMMPAIWWNLAAWLLWGFFVASLRYRSVLRAQVAQVAEEVRLLELPLEMPLELPLEMPLERVAGKSGLAAGDRA